MTVLTADQWIRASALFDQAIDWPVNQRAARLTAACDDPAVVSEVTSLLAAGAATEGFFERAPRLDGLADDAELTPDSRIGAWRIVRGIGRGGMGAVYEAARAEGGFDQRAALKVILIDAVGGAVRVEDERAIVARLDHPGIARLYDGGVDSAGHTYMAMEFVDGEPITDYARTRALSLRQRLGLFAQVCDAVAYAHNHLVVHLDIKPGNVFVTREGVVKLLDFGAARVLQAGLPDAAAAAMLTPAYAAPEQMARASVSTATDVYGLGVLLYELLAGGLPWLIEPGAHGAVSPSAFAATRPSSPVPTAKLRGDLDAVVARAMAEDPRARYPNAGALGADIARHLADAPVVARGASRTYVAGRTLRRYRWPVAAVGGVVGALSLGVVGTTIQAHRAAVERDHFQAEVARGDATMDYFALMFHTAGAQADGKPVTAQDVLARSSANLDKTFASDPAKYGRVVEFLANLYAEMTDETAGGALERRYLASKAATSDPATASRVRVMLAQSPLRQGKPDEAGPVLTRAQAFWAGVPDRYLGETARSRIVEGQIKKATKDLPGAIAVFRQGLAESQRPGAALAPEDASNLNNSLALALMADGSYDEADTLMAQVRAFREREGRTDDNLLTAIQNQGAIAIAKGDYARGEGLLNQSIAARRAQFGPSGAMAAAQINLVRAELLQNKLDPAAQNAAEAQGIALKYTGPKSPLTVGVTVLMAVAAVARGAPDAGARLDAAVAATAAKPDPLHALTLAAQARRMAKLGRPTEARALYAQARAMLASAGKAGKGNAAIVDWLEKEGALPGRPA